MKGTSGMVNNMVCGLVFYKKWTEKNEVHFEKGKKVGLNTIWFESGQKKGEESYKDDELDGSYTEWFEDGRVKYAAFFKDGVLVEKDGESAE